MKRDMVPCVVNLCFSDPLKQVDFLENHSLPIRTYFEPMLEAHPDVAEKVRL